MRWTRKPAPLDGTAAPGWDKRAWTVGIVASAFLEGGVLASTNPALKAALASRYPIVLWGDDAAGLVGDAAAWGQVLLLPVVLAVIARRRPFLWSALPLLIMLGSNAVWGIVRHQKNWVSVYFSPDQILTNGTLWVFVTVLGLGVRGLIRRRQRIREARSMVASPTEAEGEVWPPPPREECSKE